MRRLSQLNFRVTQVGTNAFVAHVDELAGVTTCARGAHAALLELHDVLEAELAGSSQAPPPLANREREEIQAAINATDPEGLLRMGCPEDEYESEVQELVARIDEASSASRADRLARDVFGRWFSTGGERRAVYRAGMFDELARILAALARSRPSP